MSKTNKIGKLGLAGLCLIGELAYGCAANSQAVRNHNWINNPPANCAVGVGESTSMSVAKSKARLDGTTKLLQKQGNCRYELPEGGINEKCNGVLYGVQNKENYTQIGDSITLIYSLMCLDKQ